MEMDADARLAAAAGGAVRFLADAAGLGNSIVAQLQLSIVAACTEAFEHLNRKHPCLEIDFTTYADRIEVALSHEGDASPAVGRDSIAGFASRAAQGSAGSAAFAGVDRVQYETRGAEVVTRLTKFLGKVTPSR